MKGDSCDTGNGRDVKNILWNNIGTFGGSQEMFCKVCGWHFDISGDVDIVDMFQKFFDLTLKQDIVHIE